jgi:hypothetical protein
LTPRQRVGGRTSRAVEVLHLIALCAFAVGWPVLDLLSKNSTFFAAHEMTGSAIVLYAVGLLAVPPLVLAAVALIVRSVSDGGGRWAQGLFVGVLGAITICTPLGRHFTSVPGLVALFYPLITVILAVAYVRFAVVHRFVTVITPAPLVFLILFLGFSPVRAYFSSAGSTGAPDLSGDPVVMLLLDEMTLPSIMNDEDEVDAKRFPNFARMAERSTWYRGATTNATQTHHAVPATFTGRYPIRGRVAPIQSRYPNNLFTYLRGTYEIHADEWITRMCPPDTCRRRLVSFGGVKHIAADTALVALRLTAPPAVVRQLPEIGQQWGGFFADRLRANERIRSLPGVVRPFLGPALDRLARDDLRPVQVQRMTAFTHAIRRTKEPAFWFLHVGLPHVPWNLLPDTRRYDDEAKTGTLRSGAYLTRDAADEALQRYLVQVQATDRLLGSLIDRLDQLDMWDDTLFVVQADHGVVFESGKRPRDVRGAEDQVLPIPLFIHYPDQGDGRIDDGRAELVDVAPTIADALGSKLPWTVDGTSLRQEDRPERRRRVWASGEEAQGFNYDDRSYTRLITRIRKLFGPQRDEDDLFAWGPHRKLVGEDRHEIDVERTVDANVRIDRPTRYDRVDVRGRWIPARVSGTFLRGVGWRWFAVVVNGRVAGLGKPFTIGRSRGGSFAILASPRFFERGHNGIEILGVSNDGTISRLR